IDDSPQAERVFELVECLGDAQRQFRRLLEHCGPSQIRAEEVERMLQSLADETSRLCGITCRCEGMSIEVPTDEVATHLYRLAQEAINNAVKHAQPSQIDIEIGLVDDRLQMTIRDDGQGFSALDTRT